MKSELIRKGAVAFPEFLAECVYMREFRKAEGLPIDLRRWQLTVDSMLNGIDASGPIYLMVDQGIVARGESHRRAGIHIDGYWRPMLHCHGWKIEPDSESQRIILASDIPGCIAYAGEVDGFPHSGGDCSHFDLSGLRRIGLEAGTVYAGNVMMMHESVPLPACRRTLVRLNVEGWT